jgi:hypothetical protein
MAVPSAHQDEMMLDGEKEAMGTGRTVSRRGERCQAAPAAILSARFTSSKWEVGEPPVTR